MTYFGCFDSVKFKEKLKKQMGHRCSHFSTFIAGHKLSSVYFFIHFGMIIIKVDRFTVRIFYINNTNRGVRAKKV